MWTKSACVVLAWSILLTLVVAVGMKGSVHPAQANIRMASSTTNITPASTLSVAAARPTATYVVQPGDTLSGIAARFAVRGGWPTLYAVNRPRIGPDPNVIHPGTVLVLPGQMGPVRYTVAAGDTLSGITAALAVHGGWPALYAANRRAIGPDPNLIRPGTVLTVPGPAAASRPASSPGRRLSPPSRSAPSRLAAAEVSGHQYAMAAVGAIGVALLALSLAGSLYVVTGLARRLMIAGLRWSAGRPGRRFLAVAVALACMTALATFWFWQGQFRGW